MATVTSPRSYRTSGGGPAWVMEVSVPEPPDWRPDSSATESEVYVHRVHEALRVAARRVTSDVRSVHYLLNIYIPGEHRCICLFEAADRAVVQLVNDTAQLPFVHIWPAVEFRGDGVFPAFPQADG
jgi:hypothetical protein